MIKFQNTSNEERCREKLGLYSEDQELNSTELSTNRER